MREITSYSRRTASIGRRRRPGPDAAGAVGTWLTKLASLGCCCLAVCLAGVGASEQSGPPRPAAATQPIRPQKYAGIREAAGQLKSDIQRFRQTKQVVKELQSTPPKPLQVFEYGPTRLTWLRNPKKYKYQYVCVVAQMGTVEEGIWHRRKAPVGWWRVPPFHIRIVRPSPAGMLDYMLTKKKIKLVKKDVTVKRTNKRTGEVLEVTRPMTVVERTDVDLPKHLKKRAEAEREGKEWTDKRRTKGRWGPTLDEQEKEEEMMKMLYGMGFESKEEVEGVFKRVDDNGKEYDVRDVQEFARTEKGMKAFGKLARKERKQQEKQGKK